MRRHGADQRRVWHKVHLTADVNGHEVRAVEMTDHRHGDSEVVPDPLARPVAAEQIVAIIGHGAYDTRVVNAAATLREAALLMPPWRKGKSWKTRTAGAGERNEMLRTIGYLSAVAVVAMKWVSPA